jgi:hypothetical protein
MRSFDHHAVVAAGSSMNVAQAHPLSPLGEAHMQTRPRRLLMEISRRTRLNWGRPGGMIVCPEEPDESDQVDLRGAVDGIDVLDGVIAMRGRFRLS